MTENTVKRRMPLHISPNTRVPYVPRDYRDLPEVQQPKYHIRPLPANIYEMRRDLISTRVDGSGSLPTGTWYMLALQSGLVGAEGPGTVPVVFDAQAMPRVVADSYLDEMSASLRQEIARAIETLSTLGPDALKD